MTAKSPSYKPDGYHTVTPYLTVHGVAALMEFVKKAFGAVENFNAIDDSGKTVHAEVTIGDTRVMMGEAGGEWKARPGTLYMYVEDTDVVYKRALEAGGKSVREPTDQPYGDRNAGVEDPSGNQWWIATRIK